MYSALASFLELGFHQHGAVSIAQFLSWLTILLDASHGTRWALFPANGKGEYEGDLALGANDPNPLKVGVYVILSPGWVFVLLPYKMLMDEWSEDGQPAEIALVKETYRPRTISSDVTGTLQVRVLNHLGPNVESLTFTSAQLRSSRDRVQERDRRCCVTREVADIVDYCGFRACHIFPIAHRDVVSFLMFTLLST
jgi:hypothetical protein